MNALSIVILIGVCLIFISIVLIYIYKKVKRMPTSDCACCQKNSKNLVKQYHKKYSKSK